MVPESPTRTHIPVQRPTADPQFAAKLRHRGVAARHRRLREAYLSLGERELAATSASRLKPRHRALADELSFELRQRREDSEHQAAASCSGVDLHTLTGE